MAIDVSSLTRSLGISVASGTGGPTNYVSNQGGQAAKPQPQNTATFASNVLKSAAGLAGAAVTGIGGGIVKDIINTGRGISQGLPGIGTIAQNQRNYNQRQAALDYARQTFTKQYVDKKISKERYSKLMQDLGAEQANINKTLQKQTSEIVPPTDFAKGLVTTATLPLAFGRITAAANAPKALAAGEQVVSKIPGVAVNATSRSVASAAAIAPLKALAYQSTGQSAVDLPGQIKNKDYKAAAGNLALLAAPVGIAGVAKLGPKAGKALGEAVYGKQAGPIIALFGDGARQADPKTAEILKRAEAFTKDQPAVRSGKYTAPAFLKQYMENTLGLSPGNVTAQEFAQRFSQYAKPVEQLNKLKAAGKIDQRAVITADYRAALPKLESQLKGVDFSNPSTLKDKANELVNALKIDNPTASDQLKSAILKSQSFDEAKTYLRAIKQLPVGEKVPGLKLPKGFAVTFGPKSQAYLPSAKEVASATLEDGKQQKPVFGVVGNLLRKTGLSTESQDPGVYDRYRKLFSSEVEKIGLNPSATIDKLQEYTRSAAGAGVLDERQLGAYAIHKALGISQPEAGKVRQAMIKAYSGLTFGELGAAGKLENQLYRIPGYGQYRRIQGLGRYQANPFFRLQQGVEAELLSQLTVKGKPVTLPGTNMLGSIFNGAKQSELQGIAQKVVNKYLGEGASGEGAANTAVGVVSAKLTRTQEYSLGGLVKQMAKNAGKSVDDFLASADPKTLDSIRMVVQYPRQGFTSSNFAKAMNMLIFPSRYNVKLAGMAGRALADMPPMMQIATIKGISDFNNFLNTPEGIKWQRDNSEILGIFNYLNPGNQINQIIRGIQNKDVSISDFGLIGGLPVGVLTQILKTQTGINTNSPYLNPKTGEVAPEKLPANQAGALKLLLIDIINSMYSFPGRTFGTDVSKNDITQMAPGLKLQSGDTKEAPARPLTPYQQKQQAVLRQSSPATGKTNSPSAGRTATIFGGEATTQRLKSMKAPVTLPPKQKKGRRAKPVASRPRPL